MTIRLIKFNYEGIGTNNTRLEHGKQYIAKFNGVWNNPHMDTPDKRFFSYTAKKVENFPLFIMIKDGTDEEVLPQHCDFVEE